MTEEHSLRIKTLKSEIFRLLKEKDDLKYRNTILNDENKTLKIDNSILKDKSLEIKNKWSDATALTIQQKLYIKEINAENEKLLKNLNVLEHTIFNDISLSDKRESDIENLKILNTNLESKNTNLEQKISQREDQINDLNREIFYKDNIILNLKEDMKKLTPLKIPVNNSPLIEVHLELETLKPYEFIGKEHIVENDISKDPIIKKDVEKDPIVVAKSWWPWG